MKKFLIYFTFIFSFLLLSVNANTTDKIRVYAFTGVWGSRGVVWVGSAPSDGLQRLQLEM